MTETFEGNENGKPYVILKEKREIRVGRGESCEESQGHALEEERGKHRHFDTQKGN